MRRIVELDALRGLTSVVIIAFHLWPDSPVFAGWFRVDMFYVLSGYVITSIILKYQDSGKFWFSFFARRALRICPPYYLAMLTILAIGPFLYLPYSTRGLPYYLTFTQNVQYYWFGEPPPFCWAMEHTWTLAVEVQLYVLLAVAVPIVGRRGLIPLAAALVAASVATRAVGFSPFILIGRADGFGAGMILAVVLFDEERVRRNLRRLRRAFGLLILAGMTFPEWGRLLFRHAIPWVMHLRCYRTLIYSLAILWMCSIYTGIVGLVVCYAGHPALKALRDWRPRYLGKISYGAYVYHSPILVALENWCHELGLGRPWWLWIATLAGTYAAAASSWQFVERPIGAMKDRFGYGPAPAPRPAPGGSGLKVPAARRA